MPVDTQQIMDLAEKLGKLLADHPAVTKYKQAQKAVSEDADASRLLAEFDRQIETLGRLEQSGQPITDAQRLQLESLQGRLVSHIKIKARSPFFMVRMCFSASALETPSQTARLSRTRSSHE